MKQKNKLKIKISKKNNLGRLIERYPQLSKVLFADYGLHCVGCIASSFDTLEEGLKIHGYGDKEIEKIVNRLNKTINND